jgi:hypothetical protein
VAGPYSNSPSRTASQIEQSLAAGVKLLASLQIGEITEMTDFLIRIDVREF